MGVVARSTVLGAGSALISPPGGPLRVYPPVWLPVGMRRTDAVAATSLVVMWSSGFIGAELGTRFAPAETLLGWRYVAAAVILGAWAASRGIRPDRRTWPRLALVGV